MLHHIPDLVGFLLANTGSVWGTWQGRMNYAEQRALFGRVIGKGLIIIDGLNETITHRVNRHNGPPVGWKFGLGLQLGQALIGVATAGRPVARHYDDGLTLEVNRTCTDGTPNANSMLYGAVWRAAKAMGYRRCITYTQADETGASLRAAGWVKLKTLDARKSWAESSVALKGKRDPVGNGGVPRVLWECRIHGA